MDGDVTAAAFAYAWWLTGDEARAEQAVRTVFAGSPSRSGEASADTPGLLRAVRAAAISSPTMCPASELTLLHDVHGLALGEAADLVTLDARDARTELAHGRLEALPETVEGDVAHPERLGGLAVGNPADVAHARQCTECGEVMSLLERGREELTELAQNAPPPPPAGLDQLAAPGAEPTSEESASAASSASASASASAEDAPSADPPPVEPTSEGPPPAPADPSSEDPAPTDPAPADPTSEEPAPEDSAPADPTSEEPAPADSAPADPTSEEPAPADPEPPASQPRIVLRAGLDDEPIDPAQLESAPPPRSRRAVATIVVVLLVAIVAAVVVWATVLREPAAAAAVTAAEVACVETPAAVANA